MGKEEHEEADEAVCGKGGVHVAELPSVSEVLVAPVGNKAFKQQAGQQSNGNAS